MINLNVVVVEFNEKLQRKCTLPSESLNQGLCSMTLVFTDLSWDIIQFESKSLD